MNNNRRDFLKKAGAIAAGGLTLPYLSQASGFLPADKPIGIQLFTVFEKMNNDPKATLEKLLLSAIKKLNQHSVHGADIMATNRRNSKKFWKIWV